MKSFLLLSLLLVGVAFVAADNGCLETSGRWCESDTSCADQALCYLCQLLGEERFDDDTNILPNDTDNNGDPCEDACRDYSDGFESSEPDFPYCPRYYCLRVSNFGTTCVRRNELRGADLGNDFDTDLAYVQPFTSLSACLASYLTNPQWCGRFGWYAMQQTTENLAQLYSHNTVNGMP
eukprot:CAMPEP_0201512320 /NCGR_PEP_ID=MMETSP0161_2-20130828/4600_1 /ASSEMBLY_ACC=CAM_ASM_000251 /TAXON_ID=180227 /ORGANISM="Neoparamoeba aestuarina, Strain SoJaBio B1-5/56/2" /LENGTH=178 /DNA_ID=CAMNT_0047908135 /DNA_START=109 /DNA_END=645 /DNA_ORIENTATION=+